MSTKDKIIKYFKDNAGSYVYIFILDDAAPLFNKDIQQKRLNQIEYVIQSAQLSSLSYNDIATVISGKIKSKYGKTPMECLKLLAQGITVYATDGSKIGSVGIGATSINAQTGLPNNYKGTFDNDTTTDGRYSRIIDCEKDTVLNIVDNKTGNILSTYNQQTNTYSGGGQSSEWWTILQSCLPAIMSLLEWLGNLLLGKNATGMNTGARQGDGWGSKDGQSDKWNNGNKSTMDLTTILLVGGIAYLALKDNGKKNIILEY
ncbi:MAG: hypothetical protein LBS50_08675 [Prevotellaceae bacterium]|jgi:hypothetical protein|nr:hypothetical protein [Prevotellaceae bacterium]